MEEELLALPAFVINLDRQPERWEKTRERLENAGFRDVRRVSAVDGKEASLPQQWDRHRPLRFDPTKLIPHAAGCMVSHLNVWKYMIDHNIPRACIFEDDVLVHARWGELAPAYWAKTPTDADMVFMGHHCGNYHEPHNPVYTCPVYCLNAYVLTLQGAVKLYHMITQYPFPETHAIDMMMVTLMCMLLRKSLILPFTFQWYVWNTQMHPDETAMSKIHPHLVEKDKGLIFQEWYDKE
jgi:GR25 family glycosyltransferase involved in LPS biosynthesis